MMASIGSLVEGAHQKLYTERAAQTHRTIEVRTHIEQKVKTQLNKKIRNESADPCSSGGGRP